MIRRVGHARRLGLVDGLRLGMVCSFWGTIIGLIVWPISRVSSAGGQSDRSRTPLEIAKERLARGEISEEEFQRLKEHLS